MNKLLLVALAIVFVSCSDDASSKKETSKIEEKTVKADAAKILLSEAAKTEVKKVEKVVAEAKVEVKEAVVQIKATKTGKEIYLKCLACHGQNAEKSALGKSKVIKGWDAKKIATALNGYQAGTYGGPMKGIMVGQVSGLNKNDIELVSEYISKL